MFLGAGLLTAKCSSIKPDNVLVGSDGRPRVADFGVARMGGGAAGGPRAAPELVDEEVVDLASTTPRLPGLTQEGTSVGTPLYMSPEQHLGDPVDGRSDQFSFCVALYEALYGQLPFNSKTLVALRLNVVRGKILPPPPAIKVPAPVHAALLPPPPTIKVPAPVHAALMRGLSTAPEQRYPSMRELLTALSFDEALDPAAAPGERRRVTIGLLAFAIFSASAQKTLQVLGMGEVKASLGVALAIFTCLCVLTYRFRNMLLKNAFHRGMILTSLILAGEVSGLRLVGLVLKLPLAQVLTIDMVALTAMSCMLSALALPSLWPLSVVSAVITLGAAWQQTYATLIGQTLFPAMIFSAVVLWNRAARQPAGKDAGRGA